MARMELDTVYDLLIDVEARKNAYRLILRNCIPERLIRRHNFQGNQEKVIAHESLTAGAQRPVQWRNSTETYQQNF